MLIADLQPGQILNGFFLVKQKQLSPFKNKPGNFLSLVLQDRTGVIRAKVWDNADNLAGCFEVGDVVDVSGSVTTYLGELQLVITDLRKAAAGTYDIEEFLPATKQDVDKMKAELKRLIESVSNLYLRRLLGSFFERPEIMADFCKAPAAKGMHQAYLGGLLEHTLHVWRIAQLMVELYPEVVDRDLLLTGVLLHDIGKIKEYSYDGLIDLTDEGRLLGHITIGAGWVQKAIAEIPGFPLEMANRVLHMVISHHGQLEFGSPKRPKTVEACILHQADLMDSQVAHFAELVEAASAESRWSQYDKALDRAVYLGDRLSALAKDESASANEDAEDENAAAGEKTDQPSLF